MNFSLNIVIEVVVFALVFALAMAGVRMAEGMLDVRRRLGNGRETVTGATTVLRSNAPTNPFIKWQANPNLSWMC